MIDFLDNADKLMCKTELLPLTHQLPCCCVKFEIFFITRPMCVSSYAEDTNDTCSCVKLYCR